MNGVVIFKGLSAAGVIQNISGLSAGTRLTTILNLTDADQGFLGTDFDAVAPADQQLVQTTSTDLSAKTFLGFF